MPISLAGEFEVKKTPEEVYDFLTDPKRFCPLLPGYQGSTIVDDKNFTVKVNVGVSHIRGTAEVKLRLAEAEKPKRARYEGQGRMAGSNMSLNAGFDLSNSSGGTKVAWKGESQIFGGLASMAGGLLEPMAKKNIQQVIDGLQKALS
ncbi:MAG TPA: carbon monoxide dehydrogenase subunit G [Terriglobales bacterium]|nr:carbon monoxide dehydrogenase subunit G [Terriglobales bacterium]